jgi:hypothetical protein
VRDPVESLGPATMGGKRDWFPGNRFYKALGKND